MANLDYACKILIILANIKNKDIKINLFGKGKGKLLN
jgi:hypothetical protein